jgi:probable HAF family extracellular repeat protein
LNNKSQIIGGLVDSRGQWQPWIWEDGTITPLGNLGGDYATPEDINDLGQVVGGSSTAAGGWHAFLWEDSVMYDLNDHIAAGSGWVLERARAINDSGWIAGYGSLRGEQLGYLLVPVAPELQAGDADMDCDFDQHDLVQVQVAGKYLTGATATWGEGDWDGAPGGSVDDKIPPPGNGEFDQLDIIAALNANIYLQGSYCASGESAGVVTPEPTTFFLLAFGLAGMLLGRRRGA